MGEQGRPRPSCVFMQSVKSRPFSHIQSMIPVKTNHFSQFVQANLNIADGPFLRGVSYICPSYATKIPLQHLGMAKTQTVGERYAV